MNNTIIINKKYILGIFLFSIISVFLLFKKPSIDINQLDYVEDNAAENIGNPILLGTAVPLAHSYADVALTGAIIPEGGDADPFEYMEGNSNSEYTMWLPISYMHEDFDTNLMTLHYTATTTAEGKNCQGYIVLKEVNPGINDIIDMSIRYNSNFMLVKGIVEDCTVIPVSPETTLKELKLLLTYTY